MWNKSTFNSANENISAKNNYWPEQMKTYNEQVKMIGHASRMSN